MSRLPLIAVLLLLAACRSDPVTLRFDGQTMGTRYSVVARDPSGALEADRVRAAVEATLAEVNGRLSNWDPQSEISRFNAMRSTEPVAISDQLAAVVEAADLIHARSMGRFDVTLGPLIELWGPHKWHG